MVTRTARPRSARATSVRQRTLAPMLSCLLGCLLSCLLVIDTARADGDARALAMGGAQTAAARGLAAAAANPALLAFSSGVTVGLAGVTVDLHNNALTLGRYNEVSGQTLSQAQKERLLADIPPTGFRLDAVATARGLGLQRGRLALTSGVISAGSGNLDRDVFDLVLFGNPPDQTVRFDDSWGEGHAIGKISLSWGQRVAAGPYGRLAVGATVSYLKGLYAVQIDEARGSVSTLLTEIDGEAYLSALLAEGGDGHGVDLGAAWQAPGGWTLGLALANATSRVAWRGKVERTEYRVTASQINLLNDDLDAGIVASDTTYAVAGHTSNLPRILRLGAAHDGGRLMVTADYVQGFGAHAGASTRPRLNLGTEWRPRGWLLPRAGMSLGGSLGTGVAGGFGLRLAAWRLDLAVMHRGGFSAAGTRGVGVGLNTQLVF
jgi:hypothetical protein